MFVAPDGSRKTVRLGNIDRKSAEAINRHAGVELWPRVWHSLQASCESDLAQSFPLAVVTKWLGNTPSVALKHYIDPTDTAYDQAACWTRHVAHG